MYFTYVGKLLVILFEIWGKMEKILLSEQISYEILTIFAPTLVATFYCLNRKLMIDFMKASLNLLFLPFIYSNRVDLRTYTIN